MKLTSVIFWKILASHQILANHQLCIWEQNHGGLLTAGPTRPGEHHWDLPVPPLQLGRSEDEAPQLELRIRSGLGDGEFSADQLMVVAIHL